MPFSPKSLLILLCFLLPAWSGCGQQSETTVDDRAAPTRSKNRLAPIASKRAVSTHAPYEVGACETCHATANAKDPGPVRDITPAHCTACHEELPGRSGKAGGINHPGPNSNCIKCHNPHNSAKKALLI